MDSSKGRVMTSFEPTPPAWRYAEVAILVAFVVSRLVYRLEFDVRFDASPVYFFVQYINPWFVEHDFWRSVLYLHHQGPLQILLAQGCIKVLGIHRGAAVLEGVYHAMGLCLALALLQTLRRLGASPAIAATAVASYSVAPSAILYESWLFYPLPTALLLVASLLALLRYQRRPSFKAGLLAFSTAGAVSLMRPTFGVAFLCGVVAVAMLCGSRAPSARPTLLRAALVPLLFVALSTAKASFLVGHPFGTALLWQNLARKVYVQLPSSERQRLTHDGMLSGALATAAFPTDARNYGPLWTAHAPTGVPLLDFDVVPGGGGNSEALEHVLVADRYFRPDALFLLSHYPQAYGRSILAAISGPYVWSAAQADGIARSRNDRQLQRLQEATDRLFGRLAGSRRLLALAVGLPLLLVYGVHRLARDRTRLESERAVALALAYVVFTIVMTGATTLLVSYGDFCRYRFDVDALYLILLACLADDFATAARRRPWRSLAPRCRAADVP